jgi:hypothetical protein
MEQQAELLFVCTTNTGGCGHVGPRHTWTGNGHMEMCPVCHKDHSFPVDLQNVDRLKEFGMDPEPVRKLLKLEEAKEIEESHDAIDRTHRGSLPAAALRGQRFVSGSIEPEDDFPR